MAFGDIASGLGESVAEWAEAIADQTGGSAQESYESGEVDVIKSLDQQTQSGLELAGGGVFGAASTDSTASDFLEQYGLLLAAGAGIIALMFWQKKKK